MNLLFSGGDLFNFFFKAFAVVISLIYLVFAIVVFRQTQVMSRSLVTKNNGIIVTISFILILIGVALIFYSIFIL